MDPLPTPPIHTPPSIKKNKPSPLYKIVLPKQRSTPDALLYKTKLRSREQPILRQPQRTNTMVWCAAIMCMIFILLVIFFGIATLIIYVAVQPRNPVFDTPQASVTAIYFNSPQFINGDATFVANFSNPNRKLNVRYEYLYVELYFSENLIATQVLEPFSQSPGEAKLILVHLLSRFVYLPPNHAVELQRQAQRNRVVYSIRGAFRVKVKTGLIHYTYWLHGECQLEMTSPPNSILITHSCTTKR